MTTTDSVQTKSPKWFWVIAIAFLLWNIMGILSFFGHTFITEEALAKLPEKERALYAEYSTWTIIVFAIATFGGLIASIGLMLKRKWAQIFFILSFLAIVPQMIHNVFFTRSIDIYGLAQAITMPVLVVLIGVFAIWFSSFSKKKEWLR
ncbi:hypothetical protein SAMN06265379_101401 [Saccharicrinis carchari]|uniref:Sugar transporter n=1 Tax=Saccharicrinis carchari TaxID=1168039 RepID=A0A521ATJ2_SACCC|nr:hypothetical protein [Saccharicrinis carchari]SMO38117.1 hypothetical protein SAMN06265379_101401 [Saccharicrinis carchari]